jgi:hypothetical protein
LDCQEAGRSRGCWRSLGGIFGSARYSVPTRFIGAQVGLRTDDGRLLVVVTGSGEVVAEHGLVAPGVPGLLTTIGADDHAWQLQRRHATLR